MRMIMTRGAVAALAVGILTTFAGAESLQLEEIVVRGEQEPPREESLSIREVRESPARDVGEALKNVEGLTYVRKGAIANDVVLRGLQKDNINVLVDGVRLHGACPNRMDPPSFHIDFAEIERVRVVKGPYDLENPGSLGGLVEVITRRPGKGPGADLSLTYGSFDRFDASAVGSYGTDRADGLLGYAHKVSDVPESGDGKRITDIYPATSPNRYRPDAIDSKAYEINTGWGKFGFNPTEKLRTELSYSYQDADHVLYPYLKMDADYDRTHRLNWTLRGENLSERVSAAALQVYWDRVDHVMDDRLRQSSVGNPRDYSMLTDATTWVVGAKATASLAVGPGTLKTGIDHYSRNWDADNRRAMFTMARPYTRLNMIPDVSTENLGVFGEYEWPLKDRLVLQGGVRGDLTRSEANQQNNATFLDDSTDFAEASGNLQLTWTAAEGLELFVGAGRGVRPPDPQELYLDVPAMAPAVTWRGNPDLDASVNHQADIGLKFSTDRLYLTGSIFYGRVDDFIHFHNSTPFLKTYENIDASFWGGEVGSQASLPYNLFLKAGLSYVEGRNEDEDRPLSEIPPLEGSVGLRYDVDTWFIEVTENFAARQDRVDSSLSEEETPGWMTTDLRAGLKYGVVSLYGGVENLLDKHYFSHLSYLRDPFASGEKVPENGRTFYATVVCAF